MGSRSPCVFNISLVCYGYNYWFCDVSSFPYIISSAVSVVIICLISHFNLFSLVSHVSCSCFSALSASLWSPVPPSLVSPVFGHHSVLYFGPYHQQRDTEKNINHRGTQCPVSGWIDLSFIQVWHLHELQIQHCPRTKTDLTLNTEAQAEQHLVPVQCSKNCSDLSTEETK